MPDIANASECAKLSRRELILAGSAAAALPIFGTRYVAAADGPSRGLIEQFEVIEAACGGRLGVTAIDTRNNLHTGYRENERFPMCSTFKVLAAGGILQRVDQARETLSRRIKFELKDVVANSPVTKERAGGVGMTISELCEAAMTRSDNTAGNMLLNALEGPQGLTAFARSLGDEITRLDRIEPDLNEAIPGDPRDTTSPAAMAANLHKLVIGDLLSVASRSQLIEWLLANKTGDARLRAKMPGDWRVGDKTGSGDRGTTNDIGVVWPPRRPPVIVCVYLTNTEASADQCNEAIAAVGRAIAAG